MMARLTCASAGGTCSAEGPAPFCWLTDRSGLSQCVLTATACSATCRGTTVVK